MTKAEKAATKQTAIRFPPDLLADLKAVSVLTGETVTALAINALRPALAKIIKDRKLGALVERVKRERSKK